MTPPDPAHPLAGDEALRKRLLALARRWLAHGGEAEDLVQDTYLRTAAGELPLTASGREAWLVTVLHHLCIDFLRRQGRYQDILAQVAEETPQGLEDWPQRLADQAQRVEAALAHLSRTLAPEDAAALLLYEIFEFSHAELGPLSGRSEDASRQHLHRLHRRLRSTPPAFPMPDDETQDDDAAYLFALCRHALAQRDPGGLIAVMRACRPQMMAALAQAPMLCSL